MSEKEMYKKLLIDEAELAKKLVSKAENILGIDNNSGSTIFLISTEDISDKQLILLSLIGRYFSNKLGFFETSSVSTSDFYSRIPSDKKSIRARLSELKKEGYIKSSERGKYVIEYSRIELILNEIKKEMGV